MFQKTLFLHDKGALTPLWHKIVDKISINNGTFPRQALKKTVFLGVNLYFSDSIKTSLGYEFGYYQSGNNPAFAEELKSNTVLAQLQVIF